ncbi:hypothetical protein SNOG_14433 [Parastagonospora nodorum SN15]|uniref:Major facilitator superfamily (MFS) profile domain-containing protein n=1 Tax=Phaeosphaeria nodorum (strain SN15 / ATCC MYA-4574 / FGSC 10173) TaxID=321614 RepID=Q0U1P7_PHANO|nr:hypothetical protein SNOG_14433 [Parastagonospora nodorum SN15]EAT78304.2 hypothetical protein SNOG_14433 [Parastagonospora nodorum SN15]
MADVGSHHFVKGAHREVLVPQPSDDPNDPLNWSNMRKLGCITSAAVVTFTQGFGPLALSPMFPAYIKDFKTDLAGAVQFTVSQLINFGSSIWRARANTYGSFMGACVLNGIGAGPAETTMPEVIADIFFLHDRGKWNTLYWVVYMGSLMVGPIISGAMTETVGWRNFWWFNTALLGLSFLMVVFMFPETRYLRKFPGDTETSTSGSSLDEKIQEQRTEETTTADGNVIEHVKTAESVLPGAKDLTVSETAARDPFLGKGAPGKWQWRIFQPNAHPFRSILLDLWTPWKLFAFPIVEFASFVVSWSCSSFLAINLTQSQVLAQPPYNFKPVQVGFTNFAIMVGAFIGLFTAGPLSDWVSSRSTRKNNGIREPEMRLPAMIPYVIIMLLGNIVVSIGYERKWPWQAIVVIGFGCAAITVNKNLWGYGLGKFITPWTLESGFIKPIMTNAALITLWCLFGILFWWKG